VTAIETVLQVILQFMTPYINIAYINILLCCRAYCCCWSRSSFVEDEVDAL